MKLKEIAEKIGAKLLGDGEIEIKGVGSLKHARSDQLSFVSGKLYLEEAKQTNAGALIVSDETWLAGKPGLLVPDAYRAFISVEKILLGEPEQSWGIDDRAVIGEKVKLGEPVCIGPYAVIETGAEIGDRVRIDAHCYIGKNVRIGAGTRLYPGVKIMERCVLGQRCIIHSGVVIGSDGFGFIPGKDGHEKIPQIGIVEIGDDVEIGANCAIDRASLDATIIGSGTKFDNLIHIAHSVKVGKNCIILAGTVVGGSVEIGEGCMVSGNVVIKDHTRLAPGTQVIGGSGVYEDTKPGEAVMGYPAMPFSQAKRAYLRLRDLPELFKRVKKLEEKLK